MKLNEIQWELAKIQRVTEALVKFEALEGEIRHVLTAHVQYSFSVNTLCFFALTLNAEVGQVFASVNPETNGALNFKHNRYQNLLNHF